MTRVSVEVPAELVEPIRETVLLLYGASAESLRAALRARAGGSGALEDVELQRARLADLDGLLAQLTGGPRRVTAARDLLHDALYGALIDSGERLAATSSRSWSGELPLERVQAAAEEVLAIGRLLRRLDADE